ncbi:uncharacterized protein LOC134847895 isoform X2 [Symsagittifera roscoffensis]|uniref:uncharacterized protein LOC134847895 isoform X2 n=1 Tax=Symsagittifera roscoffensis TaxID=84072 RepID=UPI00307BA19F
MINAAAQNFAVMAPTFAKMIDESSNGRLADPQKVANAWTGESGIQSEEPVRWKHRSKAQTELEKKLSTAILKDLNDQDSKTKRRLVSRFSVVEELNTDISKDGQGDSGIWGDTNDGKNNDASDDDSSSGSESDVVDDSDHFPILDPSQNAKMSIHEISVYAHFLKIGDIDTKNQRFSALVELIARWIPEKNKLFNDFFKVCKEQPNLDVDDGRFGIRKIIPKLLVNNLESSSLEKTSFSMRPASAPDYTCVKYVEMHKVIRGVFYERLELQSFPFDVQDICLRISLDHASQTSFRLFVPEPNCPAGLLDDSTTFQDDQEWVLRRIVASGENNEDDETDASSMSHPEDNQILIIRTNVQRKFNYFIYNCFLVMVFFSIMSYGNFANKPENVQFRLGGALTLVLTAVTYKLMLSNSLPTISYLTLIDIYVLFQIFMMTNLAVTFAVLHWVWRWYADQIDLEEPFQKCLHRFQFTSPTNKCELTALSNMLDVICVSAHGTIQILFNISFTIYVYQKNKKETDSFMEQEAEYRKFLESNPEMQEMWKRMNYPRRSKNGVKQISIQDEMPQQNSLRGKTNDKAKNTGGDTPMKTAQLIV